MAKSQKVQKVGSSVKLPKGYKVVLESLRKRIKSAQLKAAVSVNRELILLYWDIGQEVLRRQNEDAWGKSTVEQLARDLRKEFPNMKGFSDRNIWHMRAIYAAYSQNFEKLKQVVSDLDESKLKQLVSEIPWGHHIALYQKSKDANVKLWYLQKTLEYGWSRSVLIHQIESDLYGRQTGSEKLTNFVQTLADPQSDLAHEMVKDPYNFEFLSLDGRAKERKLHQALIKHLQEFLIELGVGFAFVGSEYRLEIGDQDFYIDLLFYHLKLHCYVVIELKTVAFQPEFAGKMNFYLSAVDDMVKQEEDKPTIGIILCQSKNKTVVEYALKDSRRPMGVSSYKLTNALPDQLKGQLPTIKQLKEGLKKN